jgi:hypothetical protein
MGSGAMIYIPSIIKTGSGTQKLIGGIQRHRQDRDCISLLLLFQNKESMGTVYGLTNTTGIHDIAHRCRLRHTRRSGNWIYFRHLV